MERTIKDVVDNLLLQVEDYGCKEPTVRLYRDACHSLINHCHRKEDELYTDQIPGEFLIKAEECFKSGLHCYEYHRFIKRTIRLLDTFAQIGKPDFRHLGGRKKYLPSPEHQDLIKRILDENRLVNDAYTEMDRIMRHFFCFLEDGLIKVPDLNDSILFRFVRLATATKQGSMYRVVRAVKLISEHFKKYRVAELNADFSMIHMKSAPIRMIPPYSHDEISRIMGCIDTETPVGMRDRAILLLTFETGLRAVDIIRLRQSDIDWRKAEVHVVQSKTSEPLSLPLNGTVMNAMAEYILNARPDSGAHEVFLRSKSPYKPFKVSCSLDGIIDKYSTLAKVVKKPYRSFHSWSRSEKGAPYEREGNGIIAHQK